MQNATVIVEPAPPTQQPVVPPTRSRSPFWSRIALGLVMLVAAFMDFYQLGQNGFGNLFYAATVKSMADNLHNFFFASYDPGGFVTVDKPPLGFWLQIISVKIFGYTAFSVYLPQALAGVLSVWLLYILVRRHFGVTAGLLAALALAISPISVITNRNNTIDSTLAFTMLLGAWAVLRAAETGKLRWLLACAALVGIGFNIKMAEAYLVVPAYGLLYLLASPKKIWTRIGHLALATILMLTISFSWIVIVDLTPTALRPYVGSTQDNSELSLALGYNGISRLLGDIGGGFSAKNTHTSTTQSTASSSSSKNSSSTGSSTSAQRPEFSGTGEFPTGEGFSGRGSSGGGTGGTGGAGGGVTAGTGTAGVLRLFEEPLAGQIAWLLPLALLGILALAWQRRPRFQSDAQQRSLILWGTWLLTMGVFFSVAGFFHQYYLTVMAPALCALFGIGAVVMWQDYRRVGWRGWLLPFALIVTALEQIYIISSEPAWGTWLIPLIAIPCFLAALVLIVLRLFPRLTARIGSQERNTHLLQTLVTLSLLALMLTSAVWSTTEVLRNTELQIPTAGPTTTTSFSNNSTTTTSDAKLISYLEAHQGSAKYLVATISSNTADSLIIETNKAVMTLGGFSGTDPILTTSQLASLVSSGQVRYFLLDSSSASGGSSSQSALVTWITKHSTVVSTSQWQSSSSSSTHAGGGFGTSNLTLYEYTATTTK